MEDSPAETVPVGRPAEALEEKITENPQAEMPEEASQPEVPKGPPEAGAEIQVAPDEDSPAETAPVTWPAVVRSPQGLNLRKGPALNYEVLCVLPDKAKVTALDLPMGAEVPGWRLVAAGERAGWVQARFLRLEY